MPETADIPTPTGLVRHVLVTCAGQAHNPLSIDKMVSTTHVQAVEDTSHTEIVPWSEKVWRKAKEEPLVPLG